MDYSPQEHAKDVPHIPPQARTIFSHLWTVRPKTHSPMQPKGCADGKYIRHKGVITDSQIAAHLAGKETYAAPVIGGNGKARVIVIDTDEGGKSDIQALLNAASLMGAVAFAVVCRGAKDHDGGHVWLLFHQDYEPERLRILAKDIVALAKLSPDTECWPKNADIRLLFGKHTHTQTRGVLLLQDGTEIDLDTHLDMGIAAVAHLDINRITPPNIERATEEPKQRLAPTVSNQTGRTSAADAVIKICNENDLIDEMERRGAKIVGCVGDSVLLSGMSGEKHNNPVTYKVSPATNGKKQIGFAYSPNALMNSPKGFSFFDVVCKLDHNDNFTSAVMALNPTTKNENAVTGNAIQLRATQDKGLKKRERTILAACGRLAGGRNWFIRGAERVAEEAGYSERATRESLQILEGVYFISEPNRKAPRNSPPSRKFIKTPNRSITEAYAAASEVQRMHPEREHTDALTQNTEHKNRELVRGGDFVPINSSVYSSVMRQDVVSEVQISEAQASAKEQDGTQVAPPSQAPCSSSDTAISNEVARHKKQSWLARQENYGTSEVQGERWLKIEKTISRVRDTTPLKADQSRLNLKHRDPELDELARILDGDSSEPTGERAPLALEAIAEQRIQPIVSVKPITAKCEAYHSFTDGWDDEALKKPYCKSSLTLLLEQRAAAAATAKIME